MLSRLAIVLAVMTSTAHAADDGPVVRGPHYDAATCERIWWSLVDVQDQLDAGCGPRVTPTRCRRIRASLEALRDQLEEMYYGGLCYLWTAREGQS